jgi:hypothetical protein
MTGEADLPKAKTGENAPVFATGKEWHTIRLINSQLES